MLQEISGTDLFFRNESENIGEIIKKDQLGQFEVYKNNKLKH